MRQAVDFVRVLLKGEPSTPSLLAARGRRFGHVRVEKISKKEHPHRDLSTALRFGRDDKG